MVKKKLRKSSINKTSNPTFFEERKLWEKGFNHVIGMDEVGRGAFAGPVVVAAVVFDKNFKHSSLVDINDSKLLTSSKRIKLSKLIKQFSKAWTIEQADVGIINRKGIGNATKTAFRKTLSSIQKKLKDLNDIYHLNDRQYVLIDGFYVKYLKGIGIKNQKAIIKGDQKIISIAAASIIAKVYRDAQMVKLSKKYTGYGFAKHKGYGTKQHQNAIKKYGLCKIHRKSFNLKKYV